MITAAQPRRVRARAARFWREYTRMRTAIFFLVGVVAIVAVGSFVPQQGIYRVSFVSNPSKPGVSDRGDQWFLSAETSTTGVQSFWYGTAVRNGDGSVVCGPMSSSIRWAMMWSRSAVAC